MNVYACKHVFAGVCLWNENDVRADVIERAYKWICVRSGTSSTAMASTSPHTGHAYSNGTSVPQISNQTWKCSSNILSKHNSKDRGANLSEKTTWCTHFCVFFFGQYLQKSKCFTCAKLFSYHLYYELFWYGFVIGWLQKIAYAYT